MPARTLRTPHHPRHLVLPESLERRTLFAAVVTREEVTDFGGSDFADGVAAQPDGRALVLGHTENDPAGNRLFVARYDVDGSLDPFFGENGRIFGAFDAFRRGSALAVDRAGRIVVAGVTDEADPQIAVVRFTRAGFLDRSYGDGGLATLNVGPGAVEVVEDVAVDPSGRVIVAGQVRAGATPSGNAFPSFLVARFESFGDIDVNFGNEDADDFGVADGVTVVPVGVGESGANGVVLDGSRIYVAGFGTEQESGRPAERRPAVIRLDSFGRPDDDFGDGSDGIVVLDVGLPGSAADIARARDGKLVVAGDTLPTLDAPGEQILVARLDRGGALDGAFGGGDGFTLSSFGGGRAQFARGVAVDRSDRVLLAGEIADGGEPAGDLNDDQFLLARYLADGTPDATFAPGGALVNEVEPGENSLELVAGLAIQKDGGKDQRVFVAGSAGTSGADQDVAVVRVATDATTRTGDAFINKGKLVVKGSERDDVITVSPDAAAGTIDVNVNGAVTRFPGGSVRRIEVGAKDGDDEVTVSVGGVTSVILGGDDDDDLRFLGEATGRIEGDDGDDDITGSIFSDRLRGGRDDDLIFGGDGDDDIDGGTGFDELFGEDGDDDLKADDGYHDDVDGGSGDDDARIDFFDFVTRVDDVDFR